MVQTDFDKLLDRYLKNKTTPEETRKINTWLEMKKTDDAGALRLTEAEEERLYQKIINPSVSSDDIRQFRPAIYRRFLESNVVRIAAGLMVVVAAIYILRPSLFYPGMHVTIAATANEKIILPDQSIIWLHKGSTLTWYSSGDNIRHVQLQGAGLFEVAKDAAHPFTITCNSITATVLGTSFLLKTAKENIELSVLTGKVKLSSLADARGIEVSPNEKVVYDGSGNASAKAVVNDEEVERITADTEYSMKFANIALPEVFARMEKKFDIKITVMNEAIARCHVTGDFTDRSLDNVLQLLREMLAVDFKIKDKSISVTGNGCP